MHQLPLAARYLTPEQAHGSSPASAPKLLWVKWVRGLCTLALCFCVISGVVTSRHWPLVGDSSLMHYVVFLQSKGAIPYKNIVDINLPGTYLFETAAISIFGGGAEGWRIYDVSLLASIIGASIALAGNKRWFGGIFAGSIFALVHLQDGLAQSGQRDLLIAALLLWAYVALFAAYRGMRPLLMSFIFGFVMGMTTIIKPVLLPLTVVLIIALLISERRQRRPYKRSFVCSISGFVLPGLGAFLWLMETGAWQAFLTDALPLIRLHADLGRRSLPYLLTHCLAPILFLCLPWLILQVSNHLFLTEERIALLLGVLGTAVAYVSQAKGFPYQRYPCLAMMLLLVGLDLDRSLKDRGLVGSVAVLTCVGTCFLFAPRLAWLTSTFSNVDPFEQALSEHLLKIDSPEKLDGNVQCLDTFGGCIQTLDEMGIRQSTGFLYDCYLFTDEEKEMERYRAAFWSAYKTANPRLVVVTNQFCFGTSRGFDKLSRWLALTSDLDRNYEEKVEWRSSESEHWWKRWQEPFEFRIYMRR
jgi:hypothetical protein